VWVKINPLAEAAFALLSSFPWEGFVDSRVDPWLAGHERGFAVVLRRTFTDNILILKVAQWQGVNDLYLESWLVQPGLLVSQPVSVAHLPRETPNQEKGLGIEQAVERLQSQVRVYRDQGEKYPPWPLTTRYNAPRKVNVLSTWVLTRKWPTVGSANQVIVTAKSEQDARDAASLSDTRSGGVWEGSEGSSLEPLPRDRVEVFGVHKLPV